GYLLPEPLKDEIRWIYGQAFICERHEQTLRLTRQGDYAALHITARRTLKNITDRNQHCEIGSADDEWGVDGMETQLIHLAYQVEGEEPIELRDKRERHPEALFVAPERVLVRPQQRVQVQTISQQTRGLNDEYNMVFGHPTRDPSVTVLVDDRLD